MASLPTSTTATTTQTHGDTCSSSSSASGSNLSFTPRLTWTNDQQGNILSAYFYGYMFANFPGAIMADLLGPRLTMSIGLSGATLFTFLIVPCAQAEANIAYILIIICRVAIGIFCGPLYASIHGLLACWVPKEERTKLAVITHSGNIFGLIVTFTVGAFIDTTEKGWEYFLYFGGALGIFSLVLWLLFIYDKPWLHPHIREDERKLIVNSLYSNIIPKPDTILDIPFKSLLTSYAVLITSLAHLANNFILYMFLTNHPKYLKTVYHVSSRQATLMTNIPFIVNFLFQMLASWGTNYLQCKYPLKSTTFFRKCVGFIGFIIAPLFLIPAGFMGCEGMIQAEVFLSLSMGLIAFNQPGFFTAMIDLSPKHAGLIMGICNAIASISGFVSPIMVSSYTTAYGYQDGWKYSFITTSCVTISLGSIWLIFGTSERQPWAEVTKKSQTISVQSDDPIRQEL